MKFPDGLSQRAFAKQAGISEVYVRSLVSQGKLLRDDEKHISLSGGLLALQKQQKQKKRAVKAVEQVEKKHNKLEEKSQDFDARYKRWIETCEENPAAVLNYAKAYYQALQTKEEKLKLDELEQRLIPREQVNADAEAAGSLVRSKLLTVASRVAPICEGRTSRDIESIVEGEINKALEGLQKLFV